MKYRVAITYIETCNVGRDALVEASSPEKAQSKAVSGDTIDEFEENFCEPIERSDVAWDKDEPVREVMDIPPPASGHKRQWVSCRECSRVSYYDYVPYSLSNPIMTLPCGHGAGQSWSGATRNISAEEAEARL